jgi:hypothetical protein
MYIPYVLSPEEDVFVSAGHLLGPTVLKEIGGA